MSCLHVAGFNAWANFVFGGSNVYTISGGNGAIYIYWGRMVGYGAVDPYWGRCGRVWRCRYLLGTVR